MRTEESKFKKVGEAEFQAFIKQWPRPLDHSISHAESPPVESWKDATSGVVAQKYGYQYAVLKASA